MGVMHQPTADDQQPGSALPEGAAPGDVPQAPAVALIRTVRRAAVIVIGVALVGAGLAMLVLPGPGLLVVAAGLAVLAREFRWARRMLDRVKRHLGRPPGRDVGGVRRNSGPAGPGAGHPTL